MTRVVEKKCGNCGRHFFSIPVDAGYSTLQYERLALPKVVTWVVGDADIESQTGGQERQEERHDSLLYSAWQATECQCKY